MPMQPGSPQWRRRNRRKQQMPPPLNVPSHLPPYTTPTQFGSMNWRRVWRKKQIQPPNSGGQGYGGILYQPFQTIAGANQASQAFPFPTFILGIKVEILLNGTWTDITSYVYYRDPIHITRGRPDESQQVNPQQAVLTLNNRDGRFSPNNTNGAYYPFVTRNVQLRISIVNSSSVTQQVYTGYRFWGEVSSWPPQWDPTGSDIYVQITASGVLRRYSQGAKIGSPLRRYYAGLINTNNQFAPIAVWPCEDQSGTSEFASLVSGIAAGTFTGAPGFGSDGTFGGSDPIPAFSSSEWHFTTGSAVSPPGTGSITENTPGTYTFRVPPGVSAISVDELVGSGGGGGYPGTGATGVGGAGGGGGGGGGQQARNTNVAVTAGIVYTYVVPPGGAGAASVGLAGQAGSAATFAGDSHTATAFGGQGGQPGTSNNGGAGGPGGTGGSEPVMNNGGQGGTGSSATTSFQGQSLQGSPGPNAQGSASGGQTSTAWTSPITGNVNVTAQGAGGGGAGGGFFGFGGAGGGGGGYSQGTIDVTQGNQYTFFAGNGGPGGVGNNNLSNISGGPGGDSSVQGDTQSLDGHSGGGGVASSNNHNLGGQGGSGNIANGEFGGVSDNTNSTGGGAGGGDAGQNFPTGHGLNAVGRTPGGPHGAGAGGGWGATSTGGGGATPGGASGQFGGGGGGGGSINGTQGRYGGGGGPGYINWNWQVPNQPSGGGGGSSGGTNQSGNSGSANGQGGSAVPGGGAGGTAGQTPNGLSPGGGGAGGVPDTGSGVVPPGAGAAGQVSFSWNGGTTSPVAADIITFLLHMDSAGSVDGAVVARAVTYGTVQTMDVIYHTAGGGQLEFKGYTGGTTYWDQTAAFTNLNGQDIAVQISLTNTGGTNATWKIQAIVPGAGSVLNTYSGNLTGITIGNVSDVFGNPNGTVTDTATSAGWFVVQQYADTLVNISPVLAGYAGETVAARLSRLCGEEGLSFTLVGNAGDTPQMGPQADDTFVNVLQYCENMDLGLLFEPRNSLGLAYRTRVSMQGQNQVFSLAYQQVNRPGWVIPITPNSAPPNIATIATSNVPLLNVGMFFQIFNSANVLKESTIFTILSIGTDFFGATSISFSPVAQTGLVTGDQIAQSSAFGQQLVLPLQPVSDDQYIRNDITITRQGGSSVVATQTTGAMSISTPPNGVGDYTFQRTVFAFSDSQLANMATWLLLLGTIQEDRFPVINVDMSRPAVTSLFSEAGTMDVGDFVEIDNPPPWVTQNSIKQLAYGFTEVLNNYTWTIGINAVPESPYSIGNPPTW